MFRTTFPVTLIFLFSPAGSAGGVSAGPVIEGVVPDNDRNTHRITEDYVQTQLDWRSYYLNRMAIRRHDLPQDTTTRHQQPAAHTD